MPDPTPGQLYIDYNYLVSRIYTHPDTAQLYEIVYTRYNRRLDTFITGARPIFDAEDVIQENWELDVEERDVYREDGKGSENLVHEMSAAYGAETS